MPACSIVPPSLDTVYPSTLPPLSKRVSGTVFKMAEFVRAQIFGTTFEITTRYASSIKDKRRDGRISMRKEHSLTFFSLSTRYTDLQPVGMGAFGLVWCVHRLETAHLLLRSTNRYI